MTESRASYTADPAIPGDTVMVLTSMLVDEFTRAGIDENCADEAALAATGLLSYLWEHQRLFIRLVLGQPGMCPPPGIDGVWREATERAMSDPEYRAALGMGGQAL